MLKLILNKSQFNFRSTMSLEKSQIDSIVDSLDYYKGKIYELNTDSHFTSFRVINEDLNDEHTKTETIFNKLKSDNPDTKTTIEQNQGLVCSALSSYHKALEEAKKEIDTKLGASPKLHKLSTQLETIDKLISQYKCSDTWHFSA